MGFFRRKASPEQVRAQQDEAIAAFWLWWAAEGRAEATRAFDEGHDGGHDLTALAERIGARVQAIADLAFETGAGRTARHVLVVTPAGDPDLRDVARRWLAAAPAADDAFEYADARQPVRDPGGLAIGLPDGTKVDLASATVVAEVEDTTVHVRVSHPAYAGLPDQAQAQITFLLLDALLGEGVVEQRIGGVEWAGTAGDGAMPLLDLPAIVDAAGAR